MRITFRLLSSLAAVLAVVIGCHKGGGSELSSKDQAAFDSASPEVKQMWTKASEASKANDYTTAYNLYYELVNMDLTPQQKQVLSKANTALNDRLMAALDKGDPAAQQAMQEMKAHPPARQPR